MRYIKNGIDPGWKVLTFRSVTELEIVATAKALV